MWVPMMWKILTARISEQIYDSLISRRNFRDEQKGCCKRTRGIEELLYVDQHILNKSKTRQKIYLWLGSTTKLDTKLSKNVKKYSIVYREDHANLGSGIDSRRSKLSSGKDIKRHIPERCTIITTICYSHDDTQPHPQEMPRRIQTQ